ADMSGVIFESATFLYDGEAKSIYVTGTLPEGVTVEYTGNNVTYAGTYTVTATIKGEGYETLVLTATLVVKATTGSGGILTPPHEF
ncbi:MAG: hypothetical protein IKV43_01895, partial [Clostridia bacterium]|nr:hypothetical protein [Clostridia bacterium]